MTGDPFATATPEDLANLCDLINDSFSDEPTRERLKRRVFEQWLRARGEEP